MPWCLHPSPNVFLVLFCLLHISKSCSLNFPSIFVAFELSNNAMVPLSKPCLMFFSRSFFFFMFFLSNNTILSFSKRGLVFFSCSFVLFILVNRWSPESPCLEREAGVHKTLLNLPSSSIIPSKPLYSQANSF